MAIISHAKLAQPEQCVSWSHDFHRVHGLMISTLGRGALHVFMKSSGIKGRSSVARGHGVEYTCRATSATKQETRL